MSRELSPREEWLLLRVGKIVYRPQTSCPCPICRDVYEKGVLITDEWHATHLADWETLYSLEDIPMQYFDTREEAIEFEKNNPPKNKE